MLSTDTVESTLKGLNAAVSDESSVTKSYSLADERNVFGDLGELKGGKNAALTINGNDKVLSGVKEDGISSYAGMSIAAASRPPSTTSPRSKVLLPTPAVSSKIPACLTFTTPA